MERERLQGEQGRVDRLLEAVAEDDADTALELLRADPSLAEARGAEGESPVLTALYHRAGAALDALLAADPSLDLFEAAALGDLPRLEELLDAEPGRLAAFSPDGWTPLHLAAFLGRKAAVRDLLGRGAPVDAVSRNPTGNQPLHAALAGGAPDETVSALLEHGAPVDARAGGGHTPLHLAASRGRTAMVERLLEAGADPDARSDDGATPAEIAAERGHPEVAGRLRGEAQG